MPTTDNKENSQEASNSYAENNQVSSPAQFKSSLSVLKEAEQNEMFGESVEGGKKRKSAGRRVSFAAKAKVRFIEEQREVESGAASTTNSSDDDAEIIKELRSDAASGVASELSYIFTAKPTGPQTTSNTSNSNSNSMSNETEVDESIQDPASSFSSFSESVEEARLNAEEDANDHENSEDGNDSDQMDMTKCVGGIIARRKNADNAAISAEYQGEDCTMDLTNCIGGILREHALKTNETHKNTASANEEDGEFTVTDMELTKIVPTNSSNRAEIKKELPEATPSSPSPFIVAQSNNNNNNSSSSSKDGNDNTASSEISFIGDMQKPAFVPSPAAKQTKMPADDLDLTAELFKNHVISNAAGGSTPLKQKQQSRIPTKSQSSPRRHSPLALNSTKNARADPQQPSSPNPKGNISAGGTSLASTPLKQTFTLATDTGMSGEWEESPTVTILLPRASLSDFLEMTGLRFLDTLSQSLDRRETIGRPRESERVSPERQLSSNVCTSVFLDDLDAGCTTLQKEIERLRVNLRRAEDKFDHSPPLLYLDYQRSLTDKGGSSTTTTNGIINKLKTLKSIARLCSKQSWYQWRHQLHKQLNCKLSENRAVLKVHLEALMAREEDCDALLREAKGSEASLRAAVNTAIGHQQILKEQKENAHEVQRLQGLLTTQRLELEALHKQSASLHDEEEGLRREIAEIEAKNQSIKTENQSLAARLPKNHRHQNNKASPTTLANLKSLFSLSQALCGWSPYKCTKEEGRVELVFNRACILVAFQVNPERIVESITFSLVQERAHQEEAALTAKAGGHALDPTGGGESRVTVEESLKNSLLLATLPTIKIDQIQPMNLQSALSHTTSLFTNILHIHHQLCKASVACTISVDTSERTITLAFLCAHGKICVCLLLTGQIRLEPSSINISNNAESIHGNKDAASNGICKNKVEAIVKRSLCEGSGVRQIDCLVSAIQQYIHEL